MHDPAGFLKFRRELPRPRPVAVRIRDFRDVYQRADDRLIAEQASRCMNCGVPYCHEACPLGNLIPDFNDLVGSGRWERAAEVLHATNNFPEFTGRLCPALCEGSCVLGIGDQPVTIKQVEVEIANQVADRGLMVPLPAKKPSGRTVAVVGSGPAGLAAAQQLARAGHAVTLYERSDALGGLMRYGIPDFKLEKEYIDRRVEQLRAEGVRFVTSCEVGVDVSATELRERHDAVLATCGALLPRDVPDTSGRALSGIHQAMDYLVGANRVVSGALSTPPIDAAGRNVIILGGGDTAADCLGVAHRQGAASAHLIEVAPEPPVARDQTLNPWPTWPWVLRTGIAHEEGGRRLFATAVREFLGDSAGRLRAVRLVDVTIAPGGAFSVEEVPGTEREQPADLALLAIGFAGTEPGPMLEQLGLARNRRGSLDCGDDWQTDVPGVFVAGDMRRGPSLIVWAIAEGRAAAAAIHAYLGGQEPGLPSPVTPKSAPLALT